MKNDSFYEIEDQLKEQLRFRKEFEPSDGEQKDHRLLSVIKNITCEASDSEQGKVKNMALNIVMHYSTNQD